MSLTNGTNLTTSLTDATTVFDGLLLSTDGGEDHDDGGRGGIAKKVGVVPTYFYLFVIYLVLICGTIGNICNFVLMLARDFRCMSYSVYLQVMAISDSLLLYTVGVEDILDHQYRSLGDFVTSSTSLCKFWSYISNVVRVTSPWLMVCLTADRFVAVVFPQKRSAFCSRRTALIISIALVLGAFCESMFSPILSKPVHEEKECSMKDWKGLTDYIIFRTLVLETSLPCVLVFCLNLIIVIVINRSRSSFAEATGFSQQPGHKKSTLVDTITISLMAVSIMMVVALVPISGIQVVEWEMENEIKRQESRLNPNDTEAVQDLEDLIHRREKVGDIWPAFNLIYLFNFALNFYVMLITGPRFRHKVFSWFRCFGCVRRRLEPLPQPLSQTTVYNDLELSSATVHET